MQLADYLPKLTPQVKGNAKGVPNSERAFFIQQIADLTGMKWKVIFGKTAHIPSNCTHWLNEMYLEALNAPKKKLVKGQYVFKTPEELKTSQQKLLWFLLKKTK